MIKETKYDRFVRMTEARTTKMISMARLLGNLTNYPQTSLMAFAPEQM